MASVIAGGSGGVPKLRWGIASLLGFGILVNYIDRVSLGVAGPQLHDDLGIGPAEFGLLSSAFFYVYAFLQIPIGVMLDRFGVVIVSRVGAFLWGFAALGTALATSFAGIFGARLFLGVAEAPAFPANAKAVGYWFPKNERGLATSLFDGAAKFSNVIAVPLVAYLIVNFGWRASFIATAILSFIYFILFTVFYRNPSQDKRLSVAERDFIAAGGAEPEGRPIQKTAGGEFWYVLRQRKVLGLTFGFAAYGYLFNLFITWLPSYLSATFHTNILKAAGYAAIAWGTATVTDLLVGGYLVDRLIRAGKDPNRVRLTVLIGGMIAGIAVVGAAYTTDINVAVFWISISLGGLAASAPVGWSIPALIAPKGTQGTVGGIMNFLNNVTGFLSPTITGLIVATTGSFALALVSAGVVLAFGIVSYVVVMGKIEPVPEQSA